MIDRLSLARIPRLTDLLIAGAMMLTVSATLAQAPSVPEPERRIVSLGADVTEILFALGLGESVVGVDSTSGYPPAVQDLPKVGYLRTLGAEGLLSLNPTHIAAAADAGPPAALAQVKDAGVTLVRVGGTPSIDGILSKIAALGRAFDVGERADALADKVKARMQRVETALSDIETRPRVLFLLNVENGTPVAAGRATAANAVIRLAGGQNVFRDYEGYKPLSYEAAVEAGPEFILLMDHTLKQVGGAEAVAALPALRLTPAGKAGKIIAMDGSYLLSFGPRTPRAILDLARHLHPEAGW